MRCRGIDEALLQKIVYAVFSVRLEGKAMRDGVVRTFQYDLLGGVHFE